MSYQPTVSVVVAAYNAADFIESAIESALAQTLAEVEVVVVDDCSSDGTFALLQSIAKRDSRVRAFQLAANTGPAGARNFGFAKADGEWIAILDSDDLMAPERLQTLVAEGNRCSADIVADDIVIFDDAGNDPPRLLIGQSETFELTLPLYLGTVLYGPGIGYGLLKPIFRRSSLLASGVRYDERLRIAEDDDLIIRLLGAKLRYFVHPRPDYAYRKHATSISHRLSYSNAASMVVASERLMAEMPQQRPALTRRHRAFRRGAEFARMIEALQARQWQRALATLAAHPEIWPLLRMPIASKLARFDYRRPKVDPRAVAALAAFGAGVSA
jgi:succinoglycan biosynthesis protein ExoO